MPFERTSENKIDIRYTTNGQNTWLYSPSGGNRGLAKLSDFSLTIRTDFRNIDYPKSTRSPNRPADASDGRMIAKWDFPGVLTNQAMGMEMPRRTNAGTIAARMSFFAPVSLLFFLTALFTVMVLKRVRLHPMYFLFIAAGFFAFHILMAYLVDIISIHGAFWICALVSVLLVVSYMRLVAGVRFAVVYVGFAQLIYLIGFSYAFLWVGMTGLTVTIGAIATLCVLMQATGKVKWHEVFRKNPPVQPPPSPVRSLHRRRRPMATRRETANRRSERTRNAPIDARWPRGGAAARGTFISCVPFCGVWTAALPSGA